MPSFFKALLTLLFASSCASIVSAQAISQPTEQKVKDLINYFNRAQDDSIYAMLSPAMKKELPVEGLKASFIQMRNGMGKVSSMQAFDTQSSDLTYRITFNSLQLDMHISFNQDLEVTELYFRPVQAAVKRDTSASSSDIAVVSGVDSLFGTLDLPPVKKTKIPLVLIISGSGPTDRNGNNVVGLNTDCYKLLAQGLEKMGIASVRYDKRGVNESSAALKSENGIRFNTYVVDCEAWIKMLKQDKRFSKIVVLGHSEGSLVGMIAARDVQVNAYISVSGLGVSADKALSQQLSVSDTADSKAADKILDSLKKGLEVRDVPSTLSDLFRPAIQPYLVSWFRFNPVTEIAKLKIPVMIIQGATDLQVTVDDARKLKAGKPDAQLRIFEQMNHIMKDAPENREVNVGTYAKPDLPLKTGLVEAIGNFVLHLPAQTTKLR